MTTRGLKLDADNNLVHVAGRLQRVADGDAIVQSLRVRLQFMQGEWFLDESEGLSYFQEILVKNPNVAQIRRLIADRIVETPGVTTLDSLALDFDRTARTLAVTFKVSTDVGELADTLTLETP